MLVIVRVSVLDQTKRCCPLGHGAIDRCNYCKAPIAKLQSSSSLRFKLLVRDISLRTVFLNGVRFDLRESVDISFLNGYVNRVVESVSESQ